MEITKGFNFCYKISQYHDEYTLIISLVYWTFYINLPNFGYDWDNWDRSWGIYWFESALWWVWNTKVYAWYAPWNYEMVRHEVMYPQGLMKPKSESWDITDGRTIAKLPYTYRLNNGEIQEREAMVYIEEREWHWRWFKWLPYPRLIRRVIEVEFNDEVGEHTGSWKGGCTGCSYEMNEGETMEQCLRRMEVERRFD
jgi:hypothetical protein